MEHRPRRFRRCSSPVTTSPRKQRPEKTRRDNGHSKKNERRVLARNKADSKLTSEYSPPTLPLVFNFVVPGPNDNFKPPNWLLENVSKVFRSPAPVPAPPPVRFDLKENSLVANEKTLKEHGYDLAALLGDHQGTTLGFGSEFRPLSHLRSIYSQHPNFPFLESVWTKGMPYLVTEELDDMERETELMAMLERGNHRSAKSDPLKTGAALSKEVEHGFSLPLPARAVPKIRGAMVQPCGLVHQLTLQADGSRKKKSRLTHDLFYSVAKTTAGVNKRIDMTECPEMIFGWCFSRTIHFISALRLAHPEHRILIAKHDFSDAHRRMMHSPEAAAQSILVWDDVAYVALRLSFGGSPNPPTWCAHSEMLTDLSNEIGLTSWEPSDMRNPVIPQTPEPITVDASIPIQPARSMAVSIPVAVPARSDDFIDDVVRVFLDTPDNRIKEPHVVPLCVCVSNRPHAGDSEPIVRRENISPSKHSAEGTPAESQVVLGWGIDTRRFVVFLPFDKHKAWSDDIREIVNDNKVSLQGLITLIGRLNHASHLMPLARNFMSRLRRKSETTQQRRQHLRLTKEELDDLRLWQKFLAQAHEGISINLLTIRHPTRLGISDSCPFGAGGFPWTGFAWRFKVPRESPLCGLDAANNLLEFLALTVTVWLLVIECRRLLLRDECLMALSDNSSAIGWVFRASNLDSGSWCFQVVQLMARKVATLVLESHNCLCAQHLPGVHNTVSDWLSYSTQARDGKKNPLAWDDPDDSILSDRFHSSIPQLMPVGFKICPLPAEILSFVGHTLRTAKSSLTQHNLSRKTMKTEPGQGGSDSARKRPSWTLSSLNHNQKRENSSCGPSWRPTPLSHGANQERFLAQIREPWRDRLCGLPQAIWLRRFGTVSNRAPFTSRTAPSCYRR